ncbi:hypothetical protein [Luteimonas saliphila]|uniref:hypothetical protein n=1 Tax=Luteimonas saliphila TaxID=2804919 RepID=UPI00192DC4AF|nr:hypothetical protein [Luteimonas saliphila]
MSSKDPQFQHAPEATALQFPLSDGRILHLRMALGSAPAIGSGPRPKSGEIVLFLGVGDHDVLSFSGELLPNLATAPAIGTGRAPP